MVWSYRPPSCSVSSAGLPGLPVKTFSTSPRKPVPCSLCIFSAERSVQKEAIGQAVLDLLELRPLARQLIGVKGAGLSVEQVKRVTIGVELVTNPSVLFLDEPTSGPAAAVLHRSRPP